MAVGRLVNRRHRAALALVLAPIPFASSCAPPQVAAPRAREAVSAVGPTDEATTTTEAATTTTTTAAPPVTRPDGLAGPAGEGGPANGALRTPEGPPPSAGADLLACIRSYEQGADGYATETGNGHHGAYQFDQPTWDGAVAGAGYPEWVGLRAGDAPPYVQDAAASWLVGRRGLQPWPTPSRYCG